MPKKAGFKKYLASTYFNTNKKNFPESGRFRWTYPSKIEELKPALFKKLYPEESYSDVKLRLLFFRIVETT